MNLRRAALCVLFLAACGKLDIGSYPSSMRETGEAGDGQGLAGGSPDSDLPGGGSAGEGGNSSNAGVSGADPSSNAGMSGADDASNGGVSGASDASSGGADNASGDGSTNGGAAGDGDDTTHAGAGGESGNDAGWSNDPSCYGIEEQCPDFLTCCDPAYVSTQAFTLGDGDQAVDARVTLFYPDVLEVTVGRFARFLDDFDRWIATGHPQAGEGEHLYIRNTGWQPEWPVPVSRRAIEQNVTTCVLPTYAQRDTNPELPMTCVSWYEAFAFCAWDGKRLLTEAEWELVAKGGPQNRLYPWGDTPEPHPDYASFECRLAGPALDCELDDIPRVGSRPLGISYDGVRDLGGSVAEWVLDLVSDRYENPCNDCANLTNPDFPTSRVFRGGGYASPADRLQTHQRNYTEAASRLNFLGFRCARSSVAL